MMPQVAPLPGAPRIGFATQGWPGREAHTSRSWSVCPTAPGDTGLLMGPASRAFREVAAAVNEVIQQYAAVIKGLLEEIRATHL